MIFSDGNRSTPWGWHLGVRCWCLVAYIYIVSLQWRHDERDGVSNHQCLDCLLNHLFRRTPKKTSGPRFNIKMTSYWYRKSHCGDKTILRPSYLHNGISYTGKTASLYLARETHTEAGVAGREARSGLVEPATLYWIRAQSSASPAFVRGIY